MSLILRLVLLCALVALLAVSVSALAAMRSVSAVLETQEQISSERAASQFRRHFSDQIEVLAFEVRDYARWDELYVNSPRPSMSWARTNLIPGGESGRLTQHMAIVEDGHVLGRYSHLGPRGPANSPDDPAEPTVIAALAKRPESNGLAWFDGHPALWARAPITRSDGGGDARGQLIALAYLNSRLVDRLAINGWTWRLLGPGAHAPPSEPGRADQRVELTAGDSQLAVLLSRPREVEAALSSRTLRALAIAGVAVGLVSAIIGVLLGWHWLHPLLDLATACRLRARGQAVALPDGGDLPETRILADDLRRLFEIEQRDRERLAADLAQVETANSLQRQWLLRLAHDVGSPVHAIDAAIRQMEERGGLLPPEDLIRLRGAIDQLLGRLQDAVGFAEGQLSDRTIAGDTALRSYAEAILNLMRERAASRQVRIEISASGEAAIDASLVTPILVNLLSNAISASGPGSSVRLDGGCEPDLVWWEVTDAGPGLGAHHRERIGNACNRGEVVPGEQGFGLGLTVAIANATRAGGRLRLMPEPHTTFRLELPRRG